MSKIFHTTTSVFRFFCYPIALLDEEHFRTNVDVVPSKLFTGWILSLGKGIRITAPESVTSQIREELTYLSEIYLK